MIHAKGIGNVVKKVSALISMFTKQPVVKFGDVCDAVKAHVESFSARQQAWSLDSAVPAGSTTATCTKQS